MNQKPTIPGVDPFTFAVSAHRLKPCANTLATSFQENNI